MSYTFVPEPRPPLLSKNISTSSTAQTKKDGAQRSSRNTENMPKSINHAASAYSYRPPPSVSSPGSLPEHGYRIQPQIAIRQAYRNSEDQGEDSDYYHESSPGRAWKEIKQAVPRVRVVGFNASTPHIPESGANVDPVPFQPRQAFNDNLHGPSGPSRRASASDRSDIFYRQTLRAAADMPHVSRIHASAVSHHRADTCKQSISHGSDLRRKTMTRAN
ncbi:hypothetical protein ACEPAH_7 [Sanghuangporus vaninii]